MASAARFIQDAAKHSKTQDKSGSPLNPHHPIPIMSNGSVFGITTSRDQAYCLVDQLKSANFANNAISALFADKSASHDFAHEMNTKATDGAVTGGVIGGALGWIAVISALALPGVGSFIAAGPIIAALSVAAIGATVGGLAGGLIGLGIPDLETKRFKGRLKGGRILISVHTENADEIARARGIFTQAGAEDIAATDEAGTSDDGGSAARLIPSDESLLQESQTTPSVSDPTDSLIGARVL
jgi:hypothetical protein